MKRRCRLRCGKDEDCDSVRSALPVQERGRTLLRRRVATSADGEETKSSDPKKAQRGFVVKDTK